MANNVSTETAESLARLKAAGVDVDETIFHQDQGSAYTRYAIHL
ncbi:MAG: hypothetical protein ACYC0L_03175 [Thermoleophilia bacterium]